MDEKEKFKELKKEFKKLVEDKRLNIDSIENLMSENIEKYKIELKKEIEELLKQNIDEKELITKKNKSGKKEDMS